MKPRKLADFLPQKPDHVDLKYLQVSVPVEMYNELKDQLKRQELTAQDVIMAGLKLFLAECGHAEENRKAK